MFQEFEKTTMNDKGQIVIPQTIRKKMGLNTETKLTVTCKGNIIVMKRLQSSNLKKKWDAIFKEFDSKNLKITDKQINDEIKKYRKTTHKAV